MIYVQLHGKISLFLLLEGKLMVITKYMISMNMHMYTWMTIHIHKGKKFKQNFKRYILSYWELFKMRKKLETPSHIAVSAHPTCIPP